ncbi:helix-turn-helix transcriptional regulator [Amycolatopsis minnesotensis]|uniref:helix-turn-helix transcriptional regulator n=1 Tax=Amycolatopsis minnesotensis TaxID=337894 RepID=UPI0031D3510C
MRSPARGLPCHDGLWPLAGRAEEVGRISAALAGGSGVVLTGARGVGRSRLLTAALERAAGSAALISPLELDRVPDGHAVVGIDDAETLDPVVAARLHHLAREGRISVVAVVCDGEWVPEGIGRLWLDGLAERVEIRPFEDHQIAEVLAVRLRSEIAPEAVRGMGMLTAGNAMLLRELTEHAVAEGSLRRERGVWRWSGLSCADGRLADVVRMRLGKLTPAETELIDLVALTGTLSLDSLPGFEEAAESLNRRGVLTVHTEGGAPRVRMTFPLCGDVVAAAMSELTARRLRAKLGVAEEIVPPVPIPVQAVKERTRETPPPVCVLGLRTLTTREREVAGYAATELTSREIAELLVVSVRTVENHLQRVYSKLGITRRADLAAALAAAGLGAATDRCRPRDTAS